MERKYLQRYRLTKEGDRRKIAWGGSGQTKGQHGNPNCPKGKLQLKDYGNGKLQNTYEENAEDELGQDEPFGI